MQPIVPLMSVLLPGATTQLKWHEKSDIALMNRCIDNQETFGIVFCTNSRDAQSTMKHVGCEAHVVGHQELSDGTHLITIEGGRRFYLGAMDTHPDGYMCAHVDYLTDMMDVDTEDSVVKTAGDLATIYEDLLASIEPEMVRVHLDADVLPHDSYRLLNAMILPDEKRQALLEVNSVKQRFKMITDLLRTEIQTLRFLLAEQDSYSPMTH